MNMNFVFAAMFWGSLAACFVKFGRKMLLPLVLICAISGFIVMVVFYPLGITPQQAAPIFSVLVSFGNMGYYFYKKND